MARGNGLGDAPAVATAISAPPGAQTVAGRYVLLRELGTGGMGSVHLAQDLQTGECVALKKLSRVDAKSVARFKREFRSLAHVQLPNVVRLYDLEHEQNGSWFLTMEYFPGIDLISWLRPSAAAPDWRKDGPRAFSVFRQLARGVSALHGAGMLHRDLKPSNVLVADERVCVLDFGLVRGIEEGGARVTEEGTLAGTPAYMAPEQVSAATLSEATDWYAFGVMLYEALSGELPFEGTIVQILRSKLEHDPPPIEQVEPDAPRELIDLCMALLRRDPSTRPSGAEILARLGASSPPGARSTVLETGALTDVQPTAARFVGCHASLERLERALSEVEQGQTVAVHVRGPSGAGKSALLEHFLSAVETRGRSPGDSDVLILRSRCYEREAMPFKALDSVMDALVSDLARRDDVAVSHLLPSDIHALAQLFPALERVPAVKKLLGMQQRVQVQARSYRQRAEAALRDLFGRLARARPLIVWVDDLHWGDLDSVAILRAWLEQTEGAPFLLLFSYRSDEMETSPALRALLAPSDPNVTRVSEPVVEVGPLPDADVRALCGDRLAVHAPGREALLARIVEEAHGNPFLASQLASLAVAKIERGESELGTLSIEELVTQTRELLPEEAGTVLAVLAVAGRPMPPKLALRVAGVRHGGRAILHALRNLNLVRTRDSDNERLIEVYHDRIREHVQRRLTAEQLRAIQGELLKALEHSGRADVDWLHSLALGAGERALALQYGIAAAERAGSSLAFERAAELYSACLELCEPNGAECAGLWRKLGLVLGQSGRGSRAAEALLTAAKLSADDAEVLHLKRLAAGHLMACGNFERGDALFEEVMAAVGIRPPRSEGKLIAAVLWERGRLRMRGLSFQTRAAEQIAPELQKRLDVLEVLRIALTGHDALRAALFGAQSLRLALDMGEPPRIIRALSAAAMASASETGARGGGSCHELLQRAQRLLEQHGGPLERLHYNVACAVSAFYESELRDVLAPADEAERAFRELLSQATDAEYTVRFAAVSCKIGALSQLNWHGFRRELLAAKQEAAATENIYALLLLTLNETIGDEISGVPELSIARLEEQRGWLPRQRFTVLHALHLISIMYSACSTGKHVWGVEHSAELWEAFLRSPLRRTVTLRALAHHVHARLLLNQHARSPGDARALRLVDKDIDAIADAGTGQDVRMRARLAMLRGDRATALELFAASLALYTQRGWHHEAVRDQFAIGRLQGGQAGEQAANEALAKMEQEFGCPDALRDMKVYLPEIAGPL